MASCLSLLLCCWLESYCFVPQTWYYLPSPSLILEARRSEFPFCCCHEVMSTSSRESSLLTSATFHTAFPKCMWAISLKSSEERSLLAYPHSVYFIPLSPLINHKQGEYLHRLQTCDTIAWAERRASRKSLLASLPTPPTAHDSF